MFDIGFSELIIIGIVSLLIIGPERLPGAIRTGSLWLGKIKRGFNDIKQEVQQELHNDAVLQDLRKTGENLKQEAASIHQDIQKTTEALSQSANIEPETEPAESVTSSPATQADNSDSTEHNHR